MSRAENLLVVADSDRDANMLYAVGMFVPDPFIYMRLRGRNYVVMSDLEIDRARKQASHCHVLALSKYLKRLRKDKVKNPGLAQVLPIVLRERRVSRVSVPNNFPLGLAAELQRNRIRVKPLDGSFFPQREIKTAAETKKISA